METCWVSLLSRLRGFAACRCPRSIAYGRPPSDTRFRLQSTTYENRMGIRSLNMSRYPAIPPTSAERKVVRA
jgi:hypothetical protein